jgi:hypothetical protein
MSRRKRKPAVPAGSRSTGSGAKAPQRSSSQLAGKRKANELARSGDSTEPANRRPGPGAGFAALPAISSVASRTCLQKAHSSVSAASALDTRSVTADTRLGASRVGAPTSPMDALHRGNSLSAVVAGETTRRTTGAVLSGKNRRRLLQSRHPNKAEKAAQATLPLRKLSGPGPLPSRWTRARGGITSPEGACRQGHQHSILKP